MQKNIADLMHQEMTRKEFIATLGFGLLSIFGFSTILHMLTGKSVGQHIRNESRARGYGANSYGR